MTDISSILHSGYQHPVSRSWQSQGRNLTKSMFMYPSEFQFRSSLRTCFSGRSGVPVFLI